MILGLQVANFFDPTEGGETERRQKLTFALRCSANLEPQCYAEYLFGALLSSKWQEDIQTLNPYLASQDVDAMMGAIGVTVLRASRIGHLNRAIGATVTLSAMLVKATKLPVSERQVKQTQLFPNIVQACERLSAQLRAKRHYVKEEHKDVHGYQYTEHVCDPRFLVFEFTWNIILRRNQVSIVTTFLEGLEQGKSTVKQMIMGAGKTTGLLNLHDYWLLYSFCDTVCCCSCCPTLGFDAC